eukprot:COSAG04_NODE_728_length_10781_cov_15.102134_6_plen_250_part_00
MKRDPTMVMEKATRPNVATEPSSFPEQRRPVKLSRHVHATSSSVTLSAAPFGSQPPNAEHASYVAGHATHVSSSVWRQPTAHVKLDELAQAMSSCAAASCSTRASSSESSFASSPLQLEPPSVSSLRSAPSSRSRRSARCCASRTVSPRPAQVSGSVGARGGAVAGHGLVARATSAPSSSATTSAIILCTVPIAPRDVLVPRTRCVSSGVRPLRLPLRGSFLLSKPRGAPSTRRQMVARCSASPKAPAK